MGLDALSRIVGFEGGWELDVFGKYWRLIEAARDDAEALAVMRHAVLITVIADLVRTYVEIRGLQSRLKAARTDVATEQKTVDLVHAFRPLKDEDGVPYWKNPGDEARFNR